MNCLRSAAGPLLGSILWLVVIGGICPALADEWRLDSWLRLGAGNESELPLTPGLDRDAIPRGGFVDVAPGGILYRPLGSGGLFSLSGNAYYEYFPSTVRRSLFASSLRAGLTQRLSGPWRLRVSAGGTFFDDSELQANRRVDGGGDLAIGPVGRRWLLELEASGQGRRYPELFVWSDAGDTVAYTETGWSVGARGRWSPSPSFWISLRGAFATSDARDPWYDLRAGRGEVLAGWRPRPGTWLVASALAEERDYFRRVPFAETERYFLVGGGIDHELGPALSLSLRYTWTVFDQVDGRTESNRLSAGLTWRFGHSVTGRVPTGGSSFSPPEPDDEFRAGEPLVLSLTSPGATTVAVVGDFNGWNPASHPLTRRAGGRWSVSLRLDAGVYQYAYLVDGKTVTPPEADEKVDDGFGGRNGLLRILAEADNPSAATASQ